LETHAVGRKNVVKKLSSSNHVLLYNIFVGLLTFRSSKTRKISCFYSTVMTKTAPPKWYAIHYHAMSRILDQRMNLSWKRFLGCGLSP